MQFLEFYLNRKHGVSGVLSEQKTYSFWRSTWTQWLRFSKRSSHVVSMTYWRLVEHDGQNLLKTSQLSYLSFRLHSLIFRSFMFSIYASHYWMTSSNTVLITFEWTSQTHCIFDLPSKAEPKYYWACCTDFKWMLSSLTSFASLSSAYEE